MGSETVTHVMTYSPIQNSTLSLIPYTLDLLNTLQVGLEIRRSGELPDIVDI